MEKIKFISKEKLYKLVGKWYLKSGSGPHESYIAQDGETYVAVDNTKNYFEWDRFEELEDAICWISDTRKE